MHFYATPPSAATKDRGVTREARISRTVQKPRRRALIHIERTVFRFSEAVFSRGGLIEWDRNSDDESERRRSDECLDRERLAAEVE